MGLKEREREFKLLGQVAPEGQILNGDKNLAAYIRLEALGLIRCIKRMESGIRIYKLTESGVLRLRELHKEINPAYAREVGTWQEQQIRVLEDLHPGRSVHKTPSDGDYNVMLFLEVRGDLHLEILRDLHRGYPIYEFSLTEQGIERLREHHGV